VAAGWSHFPTCPAVCPMVKGPEEALLNAAEAESAWLATNEKWGKAKSEKTARLVARLPRSIHRGLQERANEEGISVNTMIVTLIAHGLGEISGSRQPLGNR